MRYPIAFYHFGGAAAHLNGRCNPFAKFSEDSLVRYFVIHDYLYPAMLTSPFIYYVGTMWYGSPSISRNETTVCVFHQHYEVWAA